MSNKEAYAIQNNKILFIFADVSWDLISLSRTAKFISSATKVELQWYIDTKQQHWQMTLRISGLEWG